MVRALNLLPTDLVDQVDNFQIEGVKGVGFLESAQGCLHRKAARFHHYCCANQPRW